jgi:hypothetical protein
LWRRWICCSSTSPALSILDDLRELGPAAQGALLEMMHADEHDEPDQREGDSLDPAIYVVWVAGYGVRYGVLYALLSRQPGLALGLRMFVAPPTRRVPRVELSIARVRLDIWLRDRLDL